MPCSHGAILISEATVDLVKVPIPVLARLILAELAERRGQDASALLTDLIRREAAAELSEPDAPLRPMPQRAGRTAAGHRPKYGVRRGQGEEPDDGVQRR